MGPREGHWSFGSVAMGVGIQIAMAIQFQSSLGGSVRGFSASQLGTAGPCLAEMGTPVLR